MTRRRARVLVPFLAVSPIVTACGGGGRRPSDTIKNIRESDAKDVEPPERADPKNLALPGLALVTNSPTWEDVADSPNGRGAVVLFVQPGSPADNKGIGRGDMITQVNGQRVTNHEHALSELYSNKGEKRELTIIGRNGKERTVSVRGEIPKRRAIDYLNGMIKNNPNDPVLRYLRAGSVGTTVQAGINDLDKALSVAPDFAEAMNKRSSILFSARLGAKRRSASRSSRTTPSPAGTTRSTSTRATPKRSRCKRMRRRRSASRPRPRRTHSRRSASIRPCRPRTTHSHVHISR
jgi:hypothetical protein